MEILNNADTLRWFFSSVFQGFAAIITLGAMFYLYFFEKSERHKSDHEERIWQIFRRIYTSIETNPEIYTKGFMNYLTNDFLPERGKETGNNALNSIKELTELFNKLEEREILLKDYVYRLLKKSVVILAISLIALLLVGFNSYLNIALLPVAVLIVILSLMYFSKIKELFVITLETRKQFKNTLSIDIPE